jgi:hypothetical protein
MESKSMSGSSAGRMRRLPARLCTAFVALALTGGSVGYAAERDDAKRIHDRLAGVPPSPAVLDEMEQRLLANDPEGAAAIAMGHPDFYRVTLKNWAKPWTNRDQTVFVPMNDYVATVVGMVRDDVPFNELLSENILYRGASGLGVPAPSASSNAHYEALEDGAYDLSDDTVLVRETQTAVYGTPADAAAGVITSRAASQAFFIDGTNRAMFRYTLMNHLCTDLEPLQDSSRPTDRIRQDVSRSPGGDSRIFLNRCSGCHTGMDPLAQAYAYYDYEYPEGAPENGRMIWNTPGTTDPESLAEHFVETRVQEKYLVNGATFAPGFITPDDGWRNFWRDGPNAALGWDFGPGSPGGSGVGAASMGRELANSQAFASCQVRKVFQTVCLRDPSDGADRTWIQDEAEALRDNGYVMKPVFANAAAYCLVE